MTTQILTTHTTSRLYSIVHFTCISIKCPMSYYYLMPTARKVITRAPVMPNARASLKQIIRLQSFRRHPELYCLLLGNTVWNCGLCKHAAK